MLARISFDSGKSEVTARYIELIVHGRRLFDTGHSESVVALGSMINSRVFRIGEPSSVSAPKTS